MPEVFHYSSVESDVYADEEDFSGVHFNWIDTQKPGENNWDLFLAHSGCENLAGICEALIAPRLGF